MLLGFLDLHHLTPQQSQAVREIKDWQESRARRDQQLFRWDGLAGTGKTSLAQGGLGTVHMPRPS